MNLSPRWVRTLGNAGVEAEHWSNVGAANATDAAIMLWARTNGYVVVTHDLDFSASLAASRARKPSVVPLRSNDVSPEAAGAVLVSALRQIWEALADGAVATVDPYRARVRMLPLGSN